MLLLYIIFPCLYVIYLYYLRYVKINRLYKMPKHEEFLKIFIKSRNSRILNIDICEIGRQCNIDDLTSLKIALELEEEGLLKAQGSGPTYSLTLKGAKSLL